MRDWTGHVPRSPQYYWTSGGHMTKAHFLIGLNFQGKTFSEERSFETL